MEIALSKSLDNRFANDSQSLKVFGLSFRPDQILAHLARLHFVEKSLPQSNCEFVVLLGIVIISWIMYLSYVIGEYMRTTIDIT